MTLDTSKDTNEFKQQLHQLSGVPVDTMKGEFTVSIGFIVFLRRQAVERVISFRRHSARLIYALL